MVTAALSETWSKVEDLLKKQDPEKEPYKSRYEALALLAEARKTLEGVEAKGDAEEKALAALDHRIGLTKVSVDERTEGSEFLVGCLGVMQKHEREFVEHLQEAWNMLGIVNFERDLTSSALEYFKLAESLYLKWKGEGIASDKHFCLTLFYMAQAYSNIGEAEVGAKYCALTLDMQVRTKTYATHDWTQNAIQLAGFYLEKGHFGTAHNLLEAATRVLREDTGGMEDLIPTGGSAGDVPANLVLGWAKFFLRLLVCSKEWKLSGGSEADRARFEILEQEIRPELTFDTLKISPCPYLGRSALFLGFDRAREAFNEGMEHFKRALDHYKLDGWVTEHFQIIMDISALYKALAVFEQDPHRVCVMHRKRSKRIESVVEDLNPKYFPGIWKSGLLELADIYREIMEVKMVAGRPPKKVYRAGDLSAQFYRKFVQAFDDAEGGLEALPEDDLLYYIKARFELGRLLHKLYNVYPEKLGDRRVCMTESLEHLQWIEEFTEKHGKTTAPNRALALPRPRR